MQSRKIPSPRQAARQQISQAITARGHSTRNIWLVRPPFSSEDLALGSDLQREAFYLLEGDPSLLDISYLPQWWSSYTGTSSRPSSAAFASIRTIDGRSAKVFMDFATGGSNGKELCIDDGMMIISQSSLDRDAQRIENWPRVLACIRRVANTCTLAAERRVQFDIQSHGRLTLRQLMMRSTDIENAILLGAVASLLRRRQVQSDLDTRPWSLSTTVQAVR